MFVRRRLFEGGARIAGDQQDGQSGPLARRDPRQFDPAHAARHHYIRDQDGDQGIGAQQREGGLAVRLRDNRPPASQQHLLAQGREDFETSSTRSTRTGPSISASRGRGRGHAGVVGRRAEGAGGQTMDTEVPPPGLLVMPA